MENKLLLNLPKNGIINPRIVNTQCIAAASDVSEDTKKAIVDKFLATENKYILDQIKEEL